MRNFTVLAILLFALLAGCSKNVPAPLGESLVWSTNGKDSRPEWTLQATYEGAYVGQSLFHATDRSALRNAELDAARQIALAIEQSLTTTQTETMKSEGNERLILDASAKTDSQVNQHAEAVLKGLSLKETYLEQWRVGDDLLWKAFVLVDKGAS